MKKVFLDSSVLFSAVNSPTGGSSKLFTIKKVRLMTSKLVLTEVERNVRKKLLEYHLERFFILVGQTTILDLTPDSSLIRKAEKIIVKKDAVILSQAKQAREDYLISLDKKHFFKDSVKGFLKPTLIMSPKEFINKFVKDNTL